MLQVHVVFLGKNSTIQTYLYTVFIDFMCIFMYDKYSMTWVLLCRMKTVLAKLQMLTLTVHITVSVMNMALMGMKHGCMGTGFIRLVMVFLAMK